MMIYANHMHHVTIPSLVNHASSFNNKAIWADKACTGIRRGVCASIEKP